MYALQNKIFDPSYLCGTLVEGCSSDKDFEKWNVTFPDVAKPPPKKPVLPPVLLFFLLPLSDVVFIRFLIFSQTRKLFALFTYPTFILTRIIHQELKHIAMNLYAVVHNLDLEVNDRWLKNQLGVQKTELKFISENTIAGFWGTSAKCDMPIWTLENLFEHLRNNETVINELLSFMQTFIGRVLL